jgi:hypothetical protein
MRKNSNKFAMTLFLSFTLWGCGGGGSTGSENTSASSLTTQTNTNQLSTQSLSDKLSYTEDGKVGTIATSSAVSSVAIADNTLFLSEGKDGVEVIRIGYNDKISSEVLFTIDNINAQHVTLSEDEQKLYIEDEVGFIQIYDISDLSHPKHIGRTTKQKIDNAAISQNRTYKYIPRGKDGLEIRNISNPSNPIIESTYKISNAFDVVLVEDDTKALIAAGAVGINLLDVSNPKRVDNIANYRIRGTEVMGLSLNNTKELLFVATGDKGVMVFNIDILLHKLGY